MTGAVVAWLVQLVWTVVRAVVERGGTAHDGRVAYLAHALAVVTDVALAASLAEAAPRLEGTRRIGAWLAAAAYLAMAACEIARTVIVYRAADTAAFGWVIGMRDYGWQLLETIAVVGVARAAGRRGAWLALPALGAVWMRIRPEYCVEPGRQVEAIASTAVAVALLVAMAREIERHAAPGSPADRARAIRGLRRGELSAWIAIAVTLTWWLPISIYIALPVAGVCLVWGGLCVSAAWTIARSGVPEVPRWPWLASAMCALWGACRLALSWGVTVSRNWGQLDEAKLHTTHWSSNVPTLLAGAFAAIGFAVTARRVRARALGWTALAYIAALALALAVHVACPEEPVAIGAGYLVANLLVLHAYRATRAVVAHPIPRARVL